MAKKDGLEIFELFRSGSQKSSVSDAPSVAAEPERRVIQPLKVSRPAPMPVPANTSASAAPESAGDTIVSVRLNTALFGLMVGAGCLFAAFALGVHYQRRQLPVGAPQKEVATVTADGKTPSMALPEIARETRREPVAPVVRPVVVENRNTPPADPVVPAVAEPKKGWSLMLMAYPEDSEGLAQRLLKRVTSAGGSEASVIKHGTTWAVVAGFSEKQTSDEAKALLRKYQNLAGRLSLNLDLTWLSQTK